MGGCISRQPAEHDPDAPLVGGRSPVPGLVPKLRWLVRQGTVRFWSIQNRVDEGYHLRLVPPFSIEGGSIPGKVMLRRDKEQEGERMLAFRGECGRGFRYKVNVTVHRSPRHLHVRHQLELGWTKRAEGEDDYAIEYELILYR